MCVSVNPRGTRRAKRYFPPHVVLRVCVVFRRPASCIAFIGVFPFSGRHTLHVIAFNPNASLVELAAVTHSCRRPRNGSSTCRRNFSTAVSNFDQILIGLFSSPVYRITRVCGKVVFFHSFRKFQFYAYETFHSVAEHLSFLFTIY